MPVIGYVTLADASIAPLRITEGEVAHGSCVIPPDPPRVPGSGPTPAVYQSPAFAPWAKVLVTDALDSVGSISVGMYLGNSPTLSPSIDNRFLLGGPHTLGLHKLDGDGNVTWRSTIMDAARTHAHRVLRSVESRDAAIITLLRPQDTAAFVLTKTSQSGVLVWSRSYGLPSDCIATPGDVVRDARDTGGFVVLGRCADTRAWFVRVSEDGDVVRGRFFEEAGASKTSLVAATSSDGDLVLTGEVMRPNELEWTFVTRLDGSDQPGASTAFQCPQRLEAQPSAIIPSEGGGVTVVGAANGLGMVARVRKDGVLGFAHYPNTGEGVPQSFVINSIVELPTTGMVIAASTADVSQDAPGTIVLAGLDSAGSPLWSRRYARALPAVGPMALPAMRLTDDGGLFVTAIGGSADGQQGNLYAMKVFAKDGSLGDGQALTSTTAAVLDATCTTATRAFAPAVTDVVVTTSDAGLVRQ